MIFFIKTSGLYQCVLSLQRGDNGEKAAMIVFREMVE